MQKNLWQFIKFTLFSVSAGIIQVVSFWLLNDVLGLTNYWMSHVPSLILSVIWNFTFNRRYTFRSDARLPRAMSLVALFYLVFTPASAWWGTLLENAGVHDWIIEVINLLTNFVLEYFYQRFVVYRDTIDTNDLAKKKSA